MRRRGEDAPTQPIPHETLAEAMARAREEWTPSETPIPIVDEEEN